MTRGTVLWEVLASVTGAGLVSLAGLQLGPEAADRLFQVGLGFGGFGLFAYLLTQIVLRWRGDGRHPQRDMDARLVALVEAETRLVQQVADGIGRMNEILIARTATFQAMQAETRAVRQQVEEHRRAVTPMVDSLRREIENLGTRISLEVAGAKDRIVAAVNESRS